MLAADELTNTVYATPTKWFGAGETGTQLTGRLMIGAGEGNYVGGPSHSPLAKKLEDSWVWSKTQGAPEGMTLAPFTLVAGSVPGTVDAEDSCQGDPQQVLKGCIQKDHGPLGEDAWCIVIPSGVTYECLDQFEVLPRFHSTKDASGASASYLGHDAYSGCHVLDDDNCQAGDSFSPSEFAMAVRDIVLANFAAHTPPIALQWTTTNLSGGGVELCFYIDNRDFTWGGFTINLYS